MSGPELSARSTGTGAVSPQIQASGSSSLTLNATEAKRRTTGDKKHLKRALSTIEKDSLRYKSNLLKPWLDENGQVIWPQSRIRVAKVVLSQSFETVMGLIITANVVIMIFETDADATCHRAPSSTLPDPSYNMSTCTSQSSSILWLSIVNYLLLTIYTVECALRAFVERGAYPWNRWNQIDLLTVVSGWGSALLASTLPINVLRILRLIRLVRAARVVISVPEFYILLSGFTSSFKAILFGSVMLVCIIVVWSIIVVEVIHPVNVVLDYPASCDNCHAKFKSVWSAMLTIFQQVVAGDSWGETSLPLVEAEPLTILILFPIMMTISLGAMNLILAVIVERATEARENDQVRKAQKKDAERESSMVELALLCDSMDYDGSGTLSLEEMLNGFDSNAHFKGLMEQMDIMREDMETIFNVLDSNRSGEVDYVEFCQHLGNFRKRDLHMMPSLIKYSIMEIRQVIKRDIVQVLEEHTEMLFDNLEVLSSVPACGEKAEEMRIRRRGAPSLRRQGKSQGKPQFFGSDPSGGSIAAAYGPELPEEVEDPHEMLECLDVTCRTLQCMQVQLDSMMSRAEQLTVAALDSAQEPFAKRKRMDWEDGAPRAEGSSSPALDMQQAADLEAKCASVLSNLEQRVREEERLQERCQSIMQALDTLMHDPDCGLAIVKQSLI